MGNEESSREVKLVGFGGNEDVKWTTGVTKLDIMMSEINRGSAKVGEISKKVQESKLKW